MREDKEKTQRESSRAKAACLLRRAKASVSKKLLQVADKIESDAPSPRANIANTLRYECILACIGSLLPFARNLPSSLAADSAPAMAGRRRGEEEQSPSRVAPAEHFLILGSNCRFERNFCTVSEVFACRQCGRSRLLRL